MNQIIPSFRDNPIFWIAFIVTIETGVSSGLVNLTHMIPDAAIPGTLAWCKALAFVGTAFITALAHPAASRNTPGSGVN